MVSACFIPGALRLKDIVTLNKCEPCWAEKPSRRLGKLAEPPGFYFLFTGIVESAHHRNARLSSVPRAPVDTIP